VFTIAHLPDGGVLWPMDAHVNGCPQNATNAGIPSFMGYSSRMPPLLVQVQNRNISAW